MVRRSTSAVALAWCLSSCASHDAGTARTSWDDLESKARGAVEKPAYEGQDLRVDWEIHAGHVMTATGSTFEPGVVIVEAGRLVYVGPPDEQPLCARCKVVDAPDGWVTPGLIDTHSHLGVYPSPNANAHEDGNEMVAPATPGVWAESSIWPYDPGFQRAVAGGVTALQILPGSANLIGGRGMVARPIPERGGRAMRFPGAPETVKMACGENPKRVYGEKGGPATRMGNVRGQRAAFAHAQAYLDRWEDDAKDAPDRDLDMDTLMGILRGDFLVQVHCYRSDDMLTFLQIADEFGFTVRSFHHAVEAYKIRDILAERHIGVSTWSDWWGFKMEAFDAVLPSVGMLQDQGVPVAVHSDSEIGIQRLNQEAAKAEADANDAGFPVTDDQALRWITANAAWILGIDDQTGTLERGKRADIVLWDAKPLSVYARAGKVWIDGMLVHDLEHPVPPWSDFEIGQEVGR